MARSNGPFGPGGAPLRRHPADDAWAPPAGGQAPGQWPPQAFPDDGHQSRQGYHFPPPEPEQNYGFNQQLLPAQQWNQQNDGAYDVGNYPTGAAHSYSDPPPFQQMSHYQQQGYGDADADYRDEFLEEEEPRRGKRWIFIAAALVGAIGVGGALAYTYRSLVAPGPGRVFVKTDPASKAKAGKELASTDKKAPNRVGEDPPAKTPPPEEDSSGDEKNLGPRTVKTV